MPPPSLRPSDAGYDAAGMRLLDVGSCNNTFGFLSSSSAASAPSPPPPGVSSSPRAPDDDGSVAHTRPRRRPRRWAVDAIDLAPACRSVWRCDFLSAPIMDHHEIGYHVISPAPPCHGHGGGSSSRGSSASDATSINITAKAGTMAAAAAAQLATAETAGSVDAAAPAAAAGAPAASATPPPEFELEAERYDAVTFCLLLSYMPTTQQVPSSLRKHAAAASRALLVTPSAGPALVTWEQQCAAAAAAAAAAALHVVRRGYSAHAAMISVRARTGSRCELLAPPSAALRGMQACTQGAEDTRAAARRDARLLPPKQRVRRVGGPSACDHITSSPPRALVWCHQPSHLLAHHSARAWLCVLQRGADEIMARSNREPRETVLSRQCLLPCLHDLLCGVAAARVVCS
jgi:hypothetical protein